MRARHSLHPIPSAARAGAHLFETEQAVAAGIGETFAFFSNAANLDATLIRDRVDYALPLPHLTAPIHALFVRPMIERIFAYRRKVISRVLG